MLMHDARCVNMFGFLKEGDAVQYDLQTFKMW